MTKIVSSGLLPSDFYRIDQFPAMQFLQRKYNVGPVQESISASYDARLYSFLQEKGYRISASLSIRNPKNQNTETLDDDDDYFNDLIQSAAPENAIPTQSLIPDPNGQNGETFDFGWFLYKDNVISLSRDGVGEYGIQIYHPIDKPSVVKEFDEFIIPVAPVVREKVATMSLLVSNKYDGPQFVSFDVPLDPIDIGLNYGKKFVEVNEVIQDKLAEGKSGLYIFRGPPGTGKSTYLKYLSQKIDREILWIPNNMGHVLEDPGFLNLLIQKQGAIIVLEDAEKIIQDRNADAKSPVSTLLNFADGFIGNVLKISIILTFNCDKASMDKALLRKGRLAFDYEFGKLSKEDAQALIDSKGIKHTATGEMSLADIYFAHDATEATELAEKPREIKCKKKKRGIRATSTGF